MGCVWSFSHEEQASLPLCCPASFLWSNPRRMAAGVLTRSLDCFSAGKDVRGIRHAAHNAASPDQARHWHGETMLRSAGEQTRGCASPGRRLARHALELVFPLLAPPLPPPPSPPPPLECASALFTNVFERRVFLSMLRGTAARTSPSSTPRSSATPRTASSWALSFSSRCKYGSARIVSRQVGPADRLGL